MPLRLFSHLFIALGHQLLQLLPNILIVGSYQEFLELTLIVVRNPRKLHMHAFLRSVLHLTKPT
jgi:hypothetical protein